METENEIIECVNCENEAEYGDFCCDCVCSFDDCEEEKEYGDYCNEHVCSASGCYNEKDEHSDYCEDCTCPNCSNQARRGETYCNDCVCSADDCENEANSGSGLCDSCECSNCYAEAVEDGLCQNCWDEQNKCVYESSENVLDHFSADKIPQDGFLAGIELEVECKNLRSNAEDVKYYVENDAILKEDGSLDDGFEIVTRPMTQNNHEKFWQWLDIDIDGLRIKDTCGLHVHVSRKALTPLALGKILVFVNAQENRHFIVKLAERNNKEYSEFKNKKLSDGTKMDDDRYVAVNITNKATIEFRIFKASLEKAKVLRALEFSLAVCRWAKFSAGINELGLLNFYEFVISNKKVYPNLFEFIKENTERFYNSKSCKFISLPFVKSNRQIELFS